MKKIFKQNKTKIFKIISNLPTEIIDQLLSKGIAKYIPTS